MSDLLTAGNLAISIRERMRSVEQMAQPGTYEHGQFMSAALFSEWPHLKFCLEVLEKQVFYSKAR